jgi:hypothetical protein
MSQHAADRLRVTIWGAQLLVDDLVGRQPQLAVQLAPAGLALGDQGLQGGDELVVVARRARRGRPRRLRLSDGVDPHPVLGHSRPGDSLADPVTSRDVYDPQVRKHGAEDRGTVQAGEAGHLRKLRQRPSKGVPVDLGAEQAVGSTAQPVHKGQIAFFATHVMTGSEGPLLPEAPVRKPGRILGQEVLPGAAGDARGCQAAAQQFGATARAGAHEVTRRWQLHPAIVPDVRPSANSLSEGRAAPAPPRTSSQQASSAHFAIWTGIRPAGSGLTLPRRGAR